MRKRRQLQDVLVRAGLHETPHRLKRRQAHRRAAMREQRRGRLRQARRRDAQAAAGDGAERAGCSTRRACHVRCVVPQRRLQQLHELGAVGEHRRLCGAQQLVRETCQEYAHLLTVSSIA